MSNNSKMMDFNFSQVMRLSNIKRWGIIEMSRDQSVAEHSYNVSMICHMIMHTMNDDRIKPDVVINWALFHDLPEVVTGDIPTPLKAIGPQIFRQMEEKLFPEYSRIRATMAKDHSMEMAIVKVADYIDAIQFAKKFCIDSRKDAVISEMVCKMDELISRHAGLLRIENDIKRWLGLGVM